MLSVFSSPFVCLSRLLSTVEKAKHWTKWYFDLFAGMFSCTGASVLVYQK